MELTAEQIKSNWDELINYIDKFISSPRKEKLIEFYNKYQDRLIVMPASHKSEYHNCFPGGYIDHVLRVIKAALHINAVWITFGVDQSTYTIEELVFSALNHDLGKLGTEEEDAYIPQTEDWKLKKGEIYQFNNKLEFMSVPDRSIYLLTSNEIEITKNEWLSIKLHDGLYDSANESYLKNWMPEQKPRTSLIYIIHQADLLAARVEFEREWFPKFKGEGLVKKETKQNNKLGKQQKALGSVKSNSLKNLLENI